MATMRDPVPEIETIINVHFTVMDTKCSTSRVCHVVPAEDCGWASLLWILTTQNFRYSCLSILIPQCFHHPAVCVFVNHHQVQKQINEKKNKTSSSIIPQVNQYCLLFVWQFHAWRVQTSSLLFLFMILASLKVKTNTWLSMLSSCKHAKLSSTKRVSFILSLVWPKSEKVQRFLHLVFLLNPFQI